MSERRYSEDEVEAILRLAIRSDPGDVSRDRLGQMADELGIPQEKLAEAESQFLAQKTDSDALQTHVNGLRRSFMSHLTVFLAVNAALFAFDFFEDGRLDYAFYSFFGWGIAIFIQAMNTFRGTRITGDEFRKLREGRTLSSAQLAALDEISAKGRMSRLEAIKELRDRLGETLPEARDAVERYAEIRPGSFL